MLFLKPILSDYQATFIPLYDQTNNLNIAIRMYYSNNNLYFLCVNPNTLQTKILAAKQTKYNRFSMKALISTPYVQLLDKFSKPPHPIQNYGVNEAKNNVNGMFLTIDMCPSTKPFEKRLFLAF